MNEAELGPPDYSIELPGYLTPALNSMLVRHWSKNRKEKLALAWRVRVAWNRPLPIAPLPIALVKIERRSIRWVDDDGMVGGCKGLLDILQPCDPKRRPYGLGFIQDDSSRHIRLHARPVKVPRKVDQGTTVRIWALSSLPPSTF